MSSLFAVRELLLTMMLTFARLQVCSGVFGSRPEHVVSCSGDKL